jgi:hypothetical protein
MLRVVECVVVPDYRISQEKAQAQTSGSFCKIRRFEGRRFPAGMDQRAGLHCSW